MSSFVFIFYQFVLSLIWLWICKALTDLNTSNNPTTTLRRGTTLFVSPTSLSHHRLAAATPAENNVTVKTGPSTMGKIEDLYTTISGSHDSFES